MVDTDDPVSICGNKADDRMPLANGASTFRVSLRAQMGAVPVRVLLQRPRQTLGDRGIYCEVLVGCKEDQKRTLDSLCTDLPAIAMI